MSLEAPCNLKIIEGIRCAVQHGTRSECLAAFCLEIDVTGHNISNVWRRHFKGIVYCIDGLRSTVYVTKPVLLANIQVLIDKASSSTFSIINNTFLFNCT